MRPFETISHIFAKKEAPLPETFEQRLKKGEYLGILESYKVKWDLEKIARDALQNFFDAGGGTLDGVRFDLIEESLPATQEGQEKQKRYKVRIEGDSNYDYRKLVHIGGTSKEGTETAGGFGEGTKIISLLLLKDFHFSEIKFGSTGWEMSFYLDILPEGSYDKPVKGLHAKLSQKNKKPGNYIEFTTDDRQNAEAFSQAKNLFYHSENKDFFEPTFESTDYGFKFLGPREKGHLYDAGQRRHFEDSAKGWNMVEGVHIWSKEKMFGNDRDRGSVSRYEVMEKTVKPMIEQANNEELILIIKQMEGIWSPDNVWSYEISYSILEQASEKLAKTGAQIPFEEKYLAREPFMPYFIEEGFKKEGFVLCHSFFRQIGMKSTKEQFQQTQEHYRTEPTLEQKRRLDLLNDAVETIKAVLKDSGEKEKIEPKAIWLYNKKNEKNIFSGEYNEKFIWLAEEIIEKSFSKALAVYLHELDHSYGTDYSAEFSYALTDTLELVIETMTAHPDKFKKLKEEWDKRLPYEKIESVE